MQNKDAVMLGKNKQINFKVHQYS